MKSPKYEHLKQKLARLVRFWKPVVGLEHWDVYIGWNEKECLGTAEAKPEYMQLKIEFNLPKIIAHRLDTGELEDLVVHELVHGAIWSLARGLDHLNPEPVVQYIEEETCTRITTALLRVRNGERRRRQRKK